MSRTTGKTEPSDLELMLYADGELDAERHADVEAYLARSAAASSKLAALGMASSIVHEGALSANPKADGIADAVMAQIAAEASRAAAPPTPSPPSTKTAPAKAGQLLRERRGKPANDNSRGIFTLAAFAVAAAAGLMLWSRADMQAPPHAKGTPETAMQETATPAPDNAAQLPQEKTDKTDKTDKDDEPAVGVAAVDFGALTGTIFYVPTGAAASNATTTVVWLNDEPAGEQ